MLTESLLVLTQTASHSTLKKQVGCFNHREVTTVADKLKRPCGYDRFALVLETNCIRQPYYRELHSQYLIICSISNRQITHSKLNVYRNCGNLI